VVDDETAAGVEKRLPLVTDETKRYHDSLRLLFAREAKERKKSANLQTSAKAIYQELSPPAEQRR
jgi:hypothetical protein